MTIEVIQKWSELIGQRDAWSDLLTRSSCNEPMLSPVWLDTWWQLFGEGRELRAVLVYEQGRLIGLAPLLMRRVRHRGVLPLRRIEFVATGEPEADEIYSEYLNIIAEKGRETRVAQQVVEALSAGKLGRWDEMVLNMMDGNARMTRALVTELRRARLLDAEVAHKPCPYIALPESWDAYLAMLSSSRRYYIKRSIRGLEKWAGKELRIERVTEPAELERGFAILSELHEQRWQSSGRSGVFASQRFTQFHRTVMPALLEAGQLELMWVSKGEQPLAAVYSIIWDDKLYFYQSGRRVDLPPKLRLGIAIHAYAIQHAIERGLRKYDFLAGDAPYKQRLALEKTPLVRVRASAPLSLPARLKALAVRGEDLARDLHSRYRSRRGPADAETADAAAPAED
ncbi:GNAT family N-acetyltransferase [Haliangium ochraceum]|uniref:Cellulose biosynthesis protein CelD n=1 Tax=Haliangium ochraceum (strain DSM 14365 / JCM 11303 / SMP-2) TaxID=502025 RepID=D0LIE7_HALO1|nr:GNAT family N-acetyltransferase [Haliangium ochraceum]ACY18303.1 cellulose biosynthesis protein CelD [Haliangium ochraceum DSM 14365]